MDKVLFVGGVVFGLAAFGAFFASYAPGFPPETGLIGVVLLVLAGFCIFLGAIIGLEDNRKS